jgi:hypothetical protein
MKNKRSVEQKISYLLAKRTRLSEKLRLKYLGAGQGSVIIVARKIGRLQWAINRRIMHLENDNDVNIFALEENRRKQVISILDGNTDLLKRHIRAMSSVVHGSWQSLP